MSRLAAAAALSLFAGTCAAQDYPNRRVTLVVPSTAGGAIQQVKSGRLVALAVSSSARSPLLPKVPAPAAVSPAVVERLNGAVVQALATPDVRTRFTEQGSEIVGSTPEAFAAWIRAEGAKWGRIVRERRITLD